MKNEKRQAGARPGPAMKLAGAAAVLLALAACGSGSGGGGPPAATLPAVLGVTSPVASEGGAGGGEAALAFRVALDGAAVTFPLTVNFTASSTAAGSPTRAVVGTSCAGTANYYIPNVPGSLTVTVNAGANTATGTLTIPSAAASRQVTVRVCPRNSATNRVINFAWNGGNASGVATGTILGAANADLTDTERLNDTNITACANGAANGLACPQADFPSQDAETGRDATPAITGSGATRTTAFLFTVLNGGAVIQDNVTGLMWQGKTNDGGLHDGNATFTWFNSDNNTNGGAAGTAAGGACNGVPAGCDTEKYVAAVNAAGLGGFNDWRLPTAQELATLVDAGKAGGPTIDAVFANQAGAPYWTATPSASDATGAWVVDFNSGSVATASKNTALRVRLVRGR